MKISIEVPGVLACEATLCAYNLEQSCHARAITIGNGVHPACDTFFPSGQHTQGDGQPAGVGACKVSGCSHNESLECTAEGIRVVPHEGHADCQTYAPR